MRNGQEKINHKKVFITIIGMVLILLFVVNSSKLLKKTSEKTTVFEGSLSYEEPVEAFVIRDEVILQGENSENGLVQILADGERAAMNQSVFRYYSNVEDKILKQISEVDEKINQALASQTLTKVNADVSSLEHEIEDTVNGMFKLNDIQKINDHKNKIETYISKKVNLTGKNSPEGSELRLLTEERDKLEKQLETSVEVISAPKAGLASYRVDGLEDKLKVGDFSYLTSNLLNSFELKVGAAVPLSNEKGKIVDNFRCYIATIIDTEKSSAAKVGDRVILRLSTSDEIDATIVHIVEEDDQRILVFEINEKVEELLEFRLITIDIIWWKYTGLKVSNQALIEEDDKIYVERNMVGYTERLLVKVLRQNDTYSIVESYSDEELESLGYSAEEISGMKNIKLYDEVVLH